MKTLSFQSVTKSSNSECRKHFYSIYNQVALVVKNTPAYAEYLRDSDSIPELG